MIATETFCEAELQYTVSFRQARRIDRTDEAPPGRFETTSSARLARISRYCRGSGHAGSGIQKRGTAKAFR